ncbi:MAG: hypothetical protein HQL97_04060 [Magnetococcales bacterium]|nr:hypothetical protein [Magnetococcales bacterium]
MGGTSLLLALLLLLAGIGSLAGLVLGGWLFLNPDANTTLERPAADALRKLSRPVRIERFVYRNHRWFGGAIVLGSLATLVAMGAYGRRVALLAGAIQDVNGFQAWLWESLLLFVGLGNFFTLVAGMLILIRPSGLKGFEAWANQPVDLALWRARWRRVFLNLMRARPRLMAGALALGGAISLGLLLRFWWRTTGG